MENVIKTWCDNNIAVNLAYRALYPKDVPVTVDGLSEEEISQRKGKLVYQDGTACSAGHSFVDVYQLDSGEYHVYIDVGTSGMFSGEAKSLTKMESFNNLVDVVDYIAKCSFGDRNSCADMLYILRIKSLREEKDQEKLIRLITEFGARPYNPPA